MEQNHYVLLPAGGSLLLTRGNNRSGEVVALSSMGEFAPCISFPPSGFVSFEGLKLSSKGFVVT